MKKTFYLFAFTIFHLSIFAQQLPDPSFENWSKSFDNNPQLANWNGSNVNQVGFKFTFIFKETNGRPGSGACAKIMNKEVGALGITETAPGYLTLGQPWSYLDGLNKESATAGTDGGIAFTYRPDSLAVWIKRTGNGQENYNIVYYSWCGTAQGSAYKSKNGGCTSTSHTDEESDIIPQDKNECSTTVSGTLIGLGWKKERTVYNDWEEIKVPINYSSDTRPEKMNIIFSAGNYPNKRANSGIYDGNTLYVDDVRLIYSSAIHELYINNIKFSAFKSYINEYTYTLGLGATDIPDIIAKRSGRTLLGNEISIQEGEVDGEPTLVTVTAEDGSSQTTYTIYFVSKQSDNSRLKDIKVNGNSISGFNEYIYSYNVVLPYGTTSIPEVTVEKGEEKQTYEITNSSETLPYTTTINVYAQDISKTTTYTINFTIGQLSDNTLSNILVAGNAINGFAPTKNNYVVELPQGTVEVPEITPVSAYPEGEQTIITTNNGLDGIYTIDVTAPGNINTRTYKLSFKTTASTNNSLQGISIDGVPLADFSPTTTNYSYQLPQGTTSLPEITYTQGDAYQIIVVTNNGVNGKYRIEVTSQSGSKKTYIINFSVYKSNISTLEEIKIGDDLLPNFSKYVTNYSYELPSGTVSLPEITYTKSDEYQSVNIRNEGVNGTTTIRVTAEDGSSTIYYILFSVQKSTNANLTNIKIDGTPLVGFSTDILNYTYTLNNDAVNCPTIEVETEFPNQRVEIIAPKLEGTATIKVFAETGDSYNIYTIDFSFEKSSNNYLNSISINGAIIPNFDKLQNNYLITLSPDDATTISFEKDDVSQSVVVIDNGLKGYSIVVTAENGTKNIYDISFKYTASENALLKDIKLYDTKTQSFVSLTDFEPNKFNYVDTLVWRTKVVPNIHPIVGHKGQVVTIHYGKVNSKTTLHVVAENGTTQDYVIDFPVHKSNITTLENIIVDGVEFAFDANQLIYDITLPYGTTTVPAIEWTKAIEEQNIKLIARSLRDTTELVVKAENGDQRTYRLTFNIAPASAENRLVALAVDGVGNLLENSSETTFTINLPYGTTEFPNISYSKNFAEQTVLIKNGGIYTPTTLTVKANQANTADKVYTLIPSVPSLSEAVLNDIQVNGITITGFNPAKFNYIVNATSTPTITYTASEGVNVTQTINNTKQVQFTVDANSNTNVYNIFVYYPDDQIPNGEFTEWTKAKYNNADKPIGWGVPADVAEVLLWTAKTGKEVFKQAESVVGFKTTYWAALLSAIPAVTTIGDINCELKVAGQTTADFSGSIAYRNTPDFAKIRYNYKTKKGNGALFAFRFDSENRDFIANTATSDWIEQIHPLSTSNLAPEQINIAINATNQTKGATADAELWVDYIRFEHSSKIDTLVFDGIKVPAFDGTTEHTFTLDTEYQGIPKLFAIGEVYDQEHSINFSDEIDNGLDKIRTATIISKAEDGTTTNYTVTFTRPKSANNHLNGIQIDGVTLADFANNKYSYTYSVPNGTTRLPDITVTQGTRHQNVEIIPNGVQSVTIRVTAENESVADYQIIFDEEKSNNTTLQEIAIAGNPTDFVFDVNEKNYIVSLPAEAQIPQVSFIKNSDGQTVTLETGETTTLNVVAENGIDRANYCISFIHNTLKTNATLQTLAIDNEPLADFDSNKYNYNYIKATDEIYLIYNKSFAIDSLTTTLYADSVVWEVINKDAEKNCYKLTFTKAVSDNADLRGIFTDGTLLTGFNPKTFDYTITSDFIPNISIEKGDQEQIITTEISENQILISVTAENGITTQTYTIDIVSALPKSTYALLDGILIDGVTLADFASNKFEYDYELPMHTKLLPTIVAIAGEENQTISIETHGVTGITTIIVKAEDGIHQQVYSIAFSVQLCSVHTLSNIELNNESFQIINEDKIKSDKLFAPNVTEYTLWCPKNTLFLPQIDPISTHSDCQVITIDTTIIEPNYAYDISIKVLAENGIDSTVYLLHINKVKSANALLQMIYTDGSSIDFNETIFNYIIDLPYGTDSVPVITCKKQEEEQMVFISEATTVNEQTTIRVVAENGSENTYSIQFNILPSSDATLSGIYIGGELISVNADGFTCDNNFAKDDYEYTVYLPVGTIELPEITWTTSVPDISSDTIIMNGVHGNTIITVIAQDGTLLDYTIIFDVLKSNNCKLSNLLIENVTIGEKQDQYEVYFSSPDFNNIANSFNADSTVYTLLYPIGSDTSDFISKVDVSYIAEEASQYVEITQVSASEINVLVTAEDGVSRKVYVIKLEILLSNNSLLKDIKLNNISLKTFDPNTFYYEYLLYQTDTIPEILPIKSEESQLVSVLKMSIGKETIITCIAEDLSTSTYRILFKYSDENPGQYPTEDDVCWTALGGGRWKASSKRDNVYIYLFDALGKLINKRKIPTIDPNNDLCSKDAAGGEIFHFDKKDQVYIYLFVYNNKKRILSGKILY